MPRLRHPGGVEGATAGPDPGPAHRWAAGSRGVVQARVALPGAGVRGAHLDRADRRHCPEGLDDRAGPAEACRQVGEQNRSVACVAREFGVGWSTVMAAVEDYGRPLVDDPARLEAVSALGLDEVSFLRANARHHTVFSTGFVDLRRGRFLDIVAGRSARAVHEWLAAMDPEWLAGIDTVAIDPFRGYATGIAAHLGHATLVVDPFHAVALANRAIDDVRRRVQNDTLGHRGRSGDPLYGIRRVLLRGAETLTDRARLRLETGLALGDPRDEVLDAWLAKESLRASYAAPTPAEAAQLFDEFVAECRSSPAPELHRLARTMARWRREILAHHITGASNGPTEAANLVLRKVVRVAHGFRSFANYRLRVLLHAGVQWHTPPPHTGYPQVLPVIMQLA